MTLRWPEGFLVGCTVRPLLAVWEVQAGGRGAGGVSDCPAAAEDAMFEVLDACPSGRGRVRYARLSWVGIGYVYGPTRLTAHRKDGVTVTVPGDAWEGLS
ncbi:hypothetical protein [Spongiactinospora sp. 9N601]|uniref:hypothetical protein n=1 Tax=Spongiactinospora sp. 9N601 TaxID=3375149 RepID=UPI00379D0A70